ncbi:restriction endonuclease subunit S [Leuconostoc citreum]|uniref:restriction endonuclease subunit S n=1 Tax=Leuconostoc citreum TaxID=33964 RepID=UPI00200A25D3|nr:restriction endonuclease subunit S [Leuconostoc citreum]MCK8605050.1 restriction endonuclease subunit S [Leuconostoc citreum]
MQTKKRKSPSLRFRGYTDDWEERKLAEVSKIKTGSSDLQDATNNGEYPFFVRSEKIERSNRYLFDGEAILIPGEGRLGEIYHYINGKFDFHQRVYKISNFTDFKVSGIYIFYYMQRNFKRHAMKFTVKATVDSLRLPMLTEFDIKIPLEEEQQKIGSFFKQLDDTIALHQRKLDLLKEQKKGFLQKMFPKNGAKVPEFRFEGFTDDWEERKLSDLTESHNSGVYIPKDQYGEGTNIIGVGDIYDSDVVDGQRYRLAPVKDKRFILHTNDLLYGESSLVPEGIARVVSVSEAGAGTAFAWHTRRFKVNQVTLNSRFLGLELDYWLPARSHLMRSSTKTALTGITTQDFFNTQIVFPSKPEQEKIATLINSLDTAIALHQRKLDLLKEQKKGFLQKMFI